MAFGKQWRDRTPLYRIMSTGQWPHYAQNMRQPLYPPDAVLTRFSSLRLCPFVRSIGCERTRSPRRKLLTEMIISLSNARQTPCSLEPKRKKWKKTRWKRVIISICVIVRLPTHCAGDRLVVLSSVYWTNAHWKTGWQEHGQWAHDTTAVDAVCTYWRPIPLNWIDCSTHQILLLFFQFFLVKHLLREKIRRIEIKSGAKFGASDRQTCVNKS